MSVFTVNILILSISIFYFVGSQIYLPFDINGPFIEEYCTLVVQNRTSEMVIEDETLQQLLPPLAVCDTQLYTDLNSNMCSSLCSCNSGDDSKQRAAYDAVPESTYNHFGRTKTNNSNFVEFDWDGLVSHNSAIECFDHFNRVRKSVDSFVTPTIPLIKYKITWGMDAINYIANNKLELLEQLEKKLTQEMRDKIRFIEHKYNCSGICSVPFFYLSQSIDKGPPEQACLLPLVEDLETTLGNYRAVIYFMALLYVAMLALTAVMTLSDLENASYREMKEQDE